MQIILIIFFKVSFALESINGKASEKKILIYVLTLISTVPDIFNLIINLGLNRKFSEESKLRWRLSSVQKSSINSTLGKASKNANYNFDNFTHTRKNSSIRETLKSSSNVIIKKDSYVFLSPQQIYAEKIHYIITKNSLRSTGSLINEKNISLNTKYMLARRRTSFGIRKSYRNEKISRRVSL